MGDRSPTVDLNDPETVARNAFHRGYTQEQAATEVAAALCHATGCDGFRCARSIPAATRIVARVWAEEAPSDA